jgi:prevent-host-death family protein
MSNQTKNTRSLSEFKRNTGKLVSRIKRTGEPMVLTVKGKAELVVQDAASYERLLEAIDEAQAVAGIRSGLEDLKQGRTQPASEAFEELRRKYNIPRSS